MTTGEDALQPYGALHVGDAVVEVDEHDLVVEVRSRADLDALVGRDDAALAERRAGADPGAAVHVEAGSGADARPVLERDRRAGGEVEAHPAADLDPALEAHAPARAHACDRGAQHRPRA